MIKIGTFLQDRYLVGKQIGEGGMGAVYLAIDQRFESRVAIKETFYNHAELNEAFEREARILNSLHHPVLPHVSDYFTEDDKNFLVMEFIEGEDLAAKLKNGENFIPADVLRWANQLLDALDYLHSQNPPIIHRDIKPQNLKITPRGDIILLDFGLAKFESADGHDVRSIFGYSKTYSPLEQIEGTGTDVRSDIFSLAATGYHLLTGRPPVDAIRRAAEIIAGNPDPLEPANHYNPELNSALVHILQTALALNPEDRYGSASAMRTAIEYALSEDSAATEESLPLIVPVAPTAEPVFSESDAETDTPAHHFFSDVPEDNSEAENDEEFSTKFVPAAGFREVPGSPVLNQYAIFGKFSRIISTLTVSAVSILAFSCIGLIIWFMSSRNDAPSAENQTPTVQAEQSASAVPPVSNEIPKVEISKTETAEEPEIKSEIPVQAALVAPKKSAAKLSAPEKEEKTPPAEKTPLLAAKRPKEAPVAAVEKKISNQPAKPAPKVQSKPVEQITRPRIVQNPASARRESSASEIRKFFIGEPLSRRDRSRRRN